MKVTNPIYARSFAHALSGKLNELGVQKVKHSHLLAIHERLILEGLAFPGFNPRKCKEATALVYDALVDLGTRVSKKNGLQAARAVLNDRTPFLRKPLFVDKADFHNEFVLEGVGIDDSHWCKTQWVPWMLEDATELLGEVNMVLKEVVRQPGWRTSMSAIQIQELERFIQSLYVNVFTQTGYISNIHVGLELLETNKPMLDRLKEALLQYGEHFDLGPHSVFGYRLQTVSAMQTEFQKSSEEEVSSVLGNTTIRILLQNEPR